MPDSIHLLLWIGAVVFARKTAISSATAFSAYKKHDERLLTRHAIRSAGSSAVVVAQVWAALFLSTDEMLSAMALGAFATCIMAFVACITLLANISPGSGDQEDEGEAPKLCRMLDDFREDPLFSSSIGNIYHSDSEDQFS